MKHSVSAFWGRRTLPALVLSVAALAMPGFSQSQAASSSVSSPSASGATVEHADQRIRFYQAQLARDPDFWTNYNRLAAAYAQKARETGDITYFELAEKSLQQSLKLESTHEEAAPAFTQLATVHLAVHRFREAGEDAEKAIALDPRDLSAVPYAGDAQLEQGNYEKSQHFYDLLADPKQRKPWRRSPMDQRRRRRGNTGP
jgi:tetratricopeptide (TPR) repeat protein